MGNCFIASFAEILLSVCETKLVKKKIKVALAKKLKDINTVPIPLEQIQIVSDMSAYQVVRNRRQHSGADILRTAGPQKFLHRAEELRAVVGAVLGALHEGSRKVDRGF